MWRILCLGVCLCLCISATGPAQAVAGDGDAISQLERARAAAQRLDYRGEFIEQRGPESSRRRITHLGSSTPEQERLQSLDGEGTETLRRDDVILTYLPAQRRLLNERRLPQAQFPGVSPLSRTQLGRDYLMRPFAGGQVAGREASAVALDARDAFHYSYRFWFDRTTGLLLRAQTVNEKGEVVEQVGFGQLAVGSFSRNLLKPSIASTRGWQVDRADMRPLDLSHWRLGWVPSGFVRIATMSRRLASATGAPRDVLQILYSNGLSSLSVFIEPWSAERSLSPLRLGALNMVGKRHGKFWLTIVGDVPLVAIRQAADAIESAQISPR
jgi:sigma-E factor negative regulatory protein RseB